jgi:Transposase
MYMKNVLKFPSGYILPYIFQKLFPRFRRDVQHFLGGNKETTIKQSITTIKQSITTMVRRTFTMKQKLDLVSIATSRISEGKSVRSVSESLGIQPCQLRKWIKKKDTFENVSKTAKTTCPGRPSILDDIEDNLLEWLFETRQTGMNVTFKMVHIQAGQLLPNFRRKNNSAQYQIVRRFLQSHRWVVRTSTHDTQKAPEEVMGLARDYIVSTKARIAESKLDKKWILNMDQTPVFFTMQPKTTLNPKGEKKVNVRKSTNSTLRLTAALTITASGEMLPPMIIFKGVSGGRIERTFNTFPENVF